MATSTERRYAPAPQLREAGGAKRLEGYAAVFNVETTIGDVHREIIRRGAFSDVIRSDDTAALFNHNQDTVIGRVSNGTLKLNEDGHGLHYIIMLNPADPDATRVAAKVERGDVMQSSFAFNVESDGEVWTRGAGGVLPLREIVRVSRLHDISPVTAAAYPQTSVSARQRAEQNLPLADVSDVCRLKLELTDMVDN
jgi:HK97 family phage prohead protease